MRERAMRGASPRAYSIVIAPSRSLRSNSIRAAR
jgi:hypothetical protein